MIDNKFSNYSEFSHEKEREIARSFMGRIEWEMIVIAFIQLFVWLTTWYLVVLSLIPLWAGFCIAVVSSSFAYLPSHAGQHGHLSGKYKNLDWLNSFVGQLSLIPLARSHEILKVLHMKHHAHTNNPDKDPDYFHTHVDSWIEAAFRIHNQSSDERVEKMVEDYSNEDPEFKLSLERGSKVQFSINLAQMVTAFFFPLETLFLWWLPLKIVTSYLGLVFSREPHNGLNPGRFNDTRFWRNGMPRFLNHSMQIHIMHHMYPKICHHDEPKAIEALRPFMIARNMPGSEDLPEKISFNPLT